MALGAVLGPQRENRLRYTVRAVSRFVIAILLVFSVGALSCSLSREGLPHRSERPGEGSDAATGGGRNGPFDASNAVLDATRTGLDATFTDGASLDGRTGSDGAPFDSGSIDAEISLDGESAVDAQSRPDTGWMADAQLPPDGTTADAMVSLDARPADCDTLFGNAREYQLCRSDDDSCSFGVRTMGETCDRVCERYGTSCLEAFDNAGACEVIHPNHDSCQTAGRITELCRCTRT